MTAGRRNRGVFVIGVLAVLLIAPPTSADPLAVVNAIRHEGCEAQPVPTSPVTANAKLEVVARELARGRRLSPAIARTEYPAAIASAFHVRGSREDEAVRGILVAEHCAGVNDARHSEAGVFVAGDETWIVLAARTPPGPSYADPEAIAARVLELVNEARREARTCGRDRYEPAGPLTLAPALTSAALIHSADMAARGSLDHRGADGTNAGERITRAGYLWRASGENIAAGQVDANAAVAAWLASPGHCATLMGSHFTETGIGFALAPTKNPAIYWTQVFAAPR
ncbi:MAG TPA: CAP domain-containing protein [Gammaproteobacteria bacterium]